MDVQRRLGTAASGSGAYEVHELVLDGRTRATVEQFDDPFRLATWKRANEELMRERGLDPEQHMVMRGMTLVRIGPSGHARARARVVELASVANDVEVLQR